MVALSPFCAHAQPSSLGTVQLRDPEQGEAPQPQRVISGGNGLTLRGFVSSLDLNFPKLLSADAERRIAAAKLLEKSGAFDPVLTHISEYLRVQDIFEPGKAKNAIHNESRIDLLTRSGMKVFAGMRLNPNDTKTPFVPTGNAGEYYGGVSVPLLRNRGINEKTAAEKQAKISQPIADQMYMSARMEIVMKAAAVYWEWAGAKARLDVAQNLMQLAIARVDQIRDRVSSGDLPAVEITEAEQEVQRRRAAVIKAERELQKASITLSVFLSRADDTATILPSATEIPNLHPLPAKIDEIERVEGRKSALSRRPELKRIAGEKQLAKVDLELARNMLLPVVDAYALQGADTGKNGIGPVVRAGVNMSIPLRQRTARGLIAAAQSKLQKLSFDEVAEKQRISAEVDDTVSAINTSVDRFIALGSEVELAAKVETGEKLRFKAGDSTLFLVNQRERTTAEAKVRMIDAHVDFLQALAAFEVVTCRL
jgi:outer membrane protein